jgi:nucleoid DNA-binding protein
MTKADIVTNISEAIDDKDLTKKQVGAVVDQFFEEVRKALISHKHIEIRGFGTFKVVERSKRKARNPRTKEPVIVPRRHVPVFKPSKAVKDKVADNK